MNKEEFKDRVEVFPDIDEWKNLSRDEIKNIYEKYEILEKEARRQYNEGEIGKVTLNRIRSLIWFVPPFKQNKIVIENHKKQLKKITGKKRRFIRNAYNRIVDNYKKLKGER